MASHRRISDFCQIYLCELMSRVVAKSGRPSDRHHLGKLILQSFRDSPEFTLQVCLVSTIVYIQSLNDNMQQSAFFVY